MLQDEDEDALPHAAARPKHMVESGNLPLAASIPCPPCHTLGRLKLCQLTVGYPPDHGPTTGSQTLCASSIPHHCTISRPKLVGLGLPSLRHSTARFFVFQSSLAPCRVTPGSSLETFQKPSKTLGQLPGIGLLVLQTFRPPFRSQMPWEPAHVREDMTTRLFIRLVFTSQHRALPE